MGLTGAGAGSLCKTRNADLDPRSIWVTTDGGTVHLSGHVHSWHEKRAAEQAAFAAAGVIHVDNEITVTA